MHVYIYTISKINYYFSFPYIKKSRFCFSQCYLFAEQTQGVLHVQKWMSFDFLVHILCCPGSQELSSVFFCSSSPSPQATQRYP